MHRVTDLSAIGGCRPPYLGKRDASAGCYGATTLFPLILDEHGYVINGNRRLSAWRNLYQEDAKKWGHFSHIIIAQVL